ncbi:MAG: DUF1275 domain-containing protein [Chloroflexi bacterium]|nr:DUF1275 domain-containing protein [Chloroflexota bacterium]
MDHRRVRDILLLVLTINAGAVDVLSYLGLQRVFTANMTGNMVLLALSAGSGEEFGAIRAACACLGYVAGALTGARLVNVTRTPEVWPRRVTEAIYLELALLALVAIGWHLTATAPARPWLEVLIAVSACAMGLQSAAAARLAVPGISTTYVTGTLTSLMAELAALSGRSSWGLRAGVVVSVAIGAAANAVILRHWPPGAVLLPLTLIIAVAVTASRSFKTAAPASSAVAAGAT